MLSFFANLRGSEDFHSNARPEHWRRTIAKLEPNGNGSLMNLLAMVNAEQVDDPHFHWWEQGIPPQLAAVDGVFTDALGASAYTGGTPGVIGQVLYVRIDPSVTDVDEQEWRTGYTVQFRIQTDMRANVNGQITGVTPTAGGKFLVGIRLQEADNNGTGASAQIQNATHLKIVGDANPEGATIPAAVQFDPVERDNYTQIFRTPIEFTRTALNTRLRTPDQRTKARIEALSLHNQQMENAGWSGIQEQITGPNGKPQRTTGGLIRYVQTYAPSNVFDPARVAAYAGQAWASYGKDFFDSFAEQVFRYGGDERIGFIGSQALQGLNQLAETFGTINLQPAGQVFGFSLRRWETPYGTIFLRRHPLWTKDPTMRRTLALVEPENVMFRPLKNSDTMYKSDEMMRKGGQVAFDGIKEEYLTEGGFEFHHADTFGIAFNLGLDSLV